MLVTRSQTKPGWFGSPATTPTGELLRNHLHGRQWPIGNPRFA